MTTLVLAADATDRMLPGLVEARIAWLAAHDLDANYIYRVEVHLIDVPLLRVFELARDADGHRFCDLGHDHQTGGCESARRAPYDVLLRVDPPEVVKQAATPTPEGEPR